MRKFISIAFLLQLFFTSEAQVSKIVNCTAGNLTTLLTSDEKNTITNLTLTGTINAVDFKTMRDNMPVLEWIDMSTVTIQYYYGSGGTYLSTTGYAANAIPQAAFFDMNTQKGKTTLKTILLPTTITTFENYAFYRTGITSIDIPSSVTSTGNLVFQECTSLIKVKLPSSLTTLGTFVFYKCSIIDTIQISSNLTSIGNGSFQGCGAYLIVDPANSKYSSIDGALLDKAQTSLVYCPVTKQGEYVVPSSVKTINDYAFEKCSNLTAITLPSTLTSIGNYAFENCSTLTFISLPNGIVTINSCTFQNCVSLQSINMPAVKTINTYAFNNCTSLQSINFTSNITTIGTNAFIRCSGLAKISFASSSTTIGANAFQYCTSLDTLTIPCSSIGDYAFADCMNLKSVTMENTVTTMGTYIFQNCTKLNSAVIPSNASLVPNYMFIGCTSLKAISLPENITIVGISAFESCTSLKSIIIPNKVVTLRGSAFRYCTALESVVIPESVTTYANSVFLGCTGLKDIYINAVTPPYISTNLDVFYNVNKTTCILHVPLGSVSAYQTATEWNTFINIDDTKFINCSAGNLSSLTTAFEKANISKLIITGTMDARDFKTLRDSLPKLTNLDISKVTILSYSGLNGTAIANTQYIGNTIPPYAFYNPATQISKTTLQTISLPTTLFAIDVCAFQSCTGLSAFNIPASVVSIANSALKGIGGNLSVQDGNTIYAVNNGILYDIEQEILMNCPITKSGNINTLLPFASIGKNAFWGCSQITSLRIPSTVTAIGSEAFSGCSKLESLYAMSSVPVDLSNSPDVFKSVDAVHCILYVPYCSNVFYFSSNQWKNFQNIINLKEMQCSAGNLSSLLSESEKNAITNLTLSGTIDARDFRTMRDEMPALSVIDISNATINAYAGKDGTVVNEDETYNQNTISQYAFFNPATNTGKHSLTKIVLPAGLISIGAYAFGNCDNFSGITLPATVKSIGTNAFKSFSGTITVSSGNTAFASFDGMLLNSAKDTLIACSTNKTGIDSLPATVKTILAYTFYDCKKLSSIIIPSTVVNIGDFAFGNCSGLTSIYTKATTIPDLTNQTEVFYNIDKSTCTLNVPASAVKSYKNAVQWKDFAHITKIIISKSISCTPGALSTILTTDEKSTVTNLTITGNIDARDIYYMKTMYVLSDLDISNSNIVQYEGKIVSDEDCFCMYPANMIPYYGFMNKTSFNKVLLPKTLTEIMWDAFSGCENLSLITIPNSVNFISSNAFTGCKSLKSITLPPMLTRIAKSTFSACDSLQSIVIPPNVTSIGEYAFGSCLNLTSVSIPESVTSIDREAFAYCGKLQSVTLPPVLTNLGLYVFKQDISLKQIIFPHSLDTIRHGTLQQCDSLRYVSLPADVKYIDAAAFESCFNLDSINIPASVTFIGPNCFDGCYNLKSIRVNSMTPVDLSSATYVFMGINKKTCKLYVPVGSKSLYPNAVQWKDFLNIQEYTEWIGSGSFTNPANWSNGIVPSNDACIFVKSGTITIDQNISVANIVISPDSKLTIANGVTVNVSENLTLQSDSQSTATIIDQGGTLAVSGTTSVQQYLTGSTNAGNNTPNGRFWYIACPISNATSKTFNAAGANMLWFWNEQLQSYTEITDNTTNLLPLNGYLTKLTSDTTLNFNQGTLNTGTFELDLTHTGNSSYSGYNLVGNPYPSYVNWDSIYKYSTNISPTIWFRTANAENTMLFETYNALSQIGTDISNKGITTAQIPPLQTFWVYAKQGGGKIITTNQMRSHHSGISLKNDPTPDKKTLRLNIGNGKVCDQTIIAFNDNASDLSDLYDSPKMHASGGYPEIYSMVENKKMVINGTPLLKSLQIPLYINIPKPGDYTISAKEIDGLDNCTITLHDLQTGDSYNLTSREEIPFSSDTASNKQRFVLTFKSDNSTTTAALPDNGEYKISGNNNTIEVRYNGNTPNGQTITVCDIMGRNIASVALKTGLTTITKELSAGVYYVKIANGSTTFYKPVIVK